MCKNRRLLKSTVSRYCIICGCILPSAHVCVCLSAQEHVAVPLYEAFSGKEGERGTGGQVICPRVNWLWLLYLTAIRTHPGTVDHMHTTPGDIQASVNINGIRRSE